MGETYPPPRAYAAPVAPSLHPIPKGEIHVLIGLQHLPQIYTKELQILGNLALHKTKLGYYILGTKQHNEEYESKQNKENTLCLVTGNKTTDIETLILQDDSTLQNYVDEALNMRDFSLNEDQQAENLGPVPDWTNLVYREMYKAIVDLKPNAIDSIREAFQMVDQDKNNKLDKSEFTNLLKELGFSGENRPALTPEEVDLLITSADSDGNGYVDYKEFLDRFWMAVNSERDWNNDKNSLETYSNIDDDINTYARSGWLLGDGEVQKLLQTSVDGFELNLDFAKPCGELRVENANLYPTCLEDGEWPNDKWLSDHGIVIVDFKGKIEFKEEQDEEEGVYQPPSQLRSKNYKGYTT